MKTKKIRSSSLLMLGIKILGGRRRIIGRDTSSHSRPRFAPMVRTILAHIIVLRLVHGRSIWTHTLSIHSIIPKLQCLHPVMGFREFARVRANPLLKYRGNQQPVLAFCCRLRITPAFLIPFLARPKIVQI